MGKYSNQYIPTIYRDITLGSVGFIFRTVDYEGSIKFQNNTWVFDPPISVDGAIAVNHNSLSNIGVNTHVQIDAHIDSVSNPHTVTKTQVGLGSVENTALSTWVGSTNITTLGTIATGSWNATTIPISKGGTGSTTAAAAINALLPSQTSNNGKFLTTDGTVTSWGTVTGGTSSSNVETASSTESLMLGSNAITFTTPLTSDEYDLFVRCYNTQGDNVNYRIPPASITTDGFTIAVAADCTLVYRASVGNSVGSGGSSLVANDDILNWDPSNLYYTPYTSKQSGLNIYTGTEVPDGSGRLNFNGYVYATKLYSNNIEVVTAASSSLLSTSVSTGSVSIGPYSSSSTGRLYLGTTTPTGTTRLNYDGYFYATKLYVGSTEITGSSTLTSGILEWGSNTYTPYTVQTDGCFDSGSVAPIHTTARLNYDGILYASRVYGYSPSGVGVMGMSYDGAGVSGFGSGSSTNGVLAQSDTGIPLKVSQTGDSSGTIAQSVVEINRTSTGTSTVSGDIIKIVDSPTTSGTISGKVLSTFIDGTERITLDPRVVDSSTAVAYFLDTNTTLSDAEAKILKIDNYGTERLTLYANGAFLIGDTLSDFTALTSNTTHIKVNNTFRTLLNPNTSDAAGAVVYTFDSAESMVTSGAKMLSIRNAGTEKAYINKDGRYNSVAGSSSTFVVTPGILKDFYTDAICSDDVETDLYTYTIPANVLSNNGDKIVAEYTITMPEYSGTLITYFASSDVGSLTSGVEGTYTVKVTIIRVSSTVARVVVDFQNSSISSYTELTAKNWTTTNILKITGNTSGGTITARMGYIEYKPSAVN